MYRKHLTYQASFTTKGGWLWGFHGLWVWLILALEFRILRLDLAGFQVLRCVTGCGFDQFLCSGFGYSFKTAYFSGFPSHTVHVFYWDRKTSFEYFKTMHRDRAKRKMLKIFNDYWRKLKIFVLFCSFRSWLFTCRFSNFSKFWSWFARSGPPKAPSQS